MTSAAITPGARYWITHPVLQAHQMGPGHPESPQRLAAIHERMQSTGLDRLFRHREAPLATEAALLRAHHPDHVHSVLGIRPESGLVQIDPDTAMNRHSAEAAQRAAGAGVLAVDLVMNGDADFVFCAVRPPGHHAERHRAMGFCLFNSIAVAAAEALAHGLERVAVLDFDVHYGNGTANIFSDDPRVLFCSTYQDPLYPYWTRKPGASQLIDVPLRHGDDGTVYRDAVTQRWLPALDTFRPQMILVSAGFDAHHRDPLAGLNFNEDDYTWTAQQIQAVCRQHCPGQVIAMLEGGYDLTALALSVEAFVRPFVEE